MGCGDSYGCGSRRGGCGHKILLISLQIPDLYATSVLSKISILSI